MENIQNYSIHSNSDSDDIPMIYIRFNINNVSKDFFDDFIDYVCNRFQIKGIKNVMINNYVNEERMLYYDKQTNEIVESK